MTEDCFSASLAPICFAILSDKIRERTAALAKLHAILPGIVKQKDFVSETAVKVLKSFLDWLHAELRTSKKTQNSNAVMAALKEIKWILGIFDASFPKIDLSPLVPELIDRLTEVLLLKDASLEIAFYILNLQVLCKSPYLKLLRDSHMSGSRINRLVSALSDQLKNSESPDSFIKFMSVLAIALPSSLKLESLTYEMFHESFLWYLANARNDLILPSLLSAVNCLLLDYFEHSSKYGIEYFPHILPLLSSSTKNPVLYNKAIQYFLQVKNELSLEQQSQLSNFLEKELEDPQLFALNSIDPVCFCKETVEGSYASFNEISRQMFLDLCSDVVTSNSHLQLTLYRLLKGKTTSNAPLSLPPLLENNKKNRNYLEWNALLQFHFTLSENNTANLFSSSKNISWYKLWYISRNSSKFTSSELKMSELDQFVEGSLKSFPQLDVLALDALAAYFQLRFKNLWWTATAKEVFKSLLECENISTLTSDPAFIKCILAPILSDYHHQPSFEYSDPKALDCILFLRRLKHLQSVKDKVFLNTEEAMDNVPYIHSDNEEMSEFYVEALKSFNSSRQRSLSESSELNSPISEEYACKASPLLSFIVSLFGSSSPLDMSVFDGPVGFGVCEVFDALGPIIAKRVELTEVLSHLIPQLQSESGNVLAVETENFDEDFKTRNSHFEVNVSLSQVFKDSTAKETALMKISRILFKHYSRNLDKVNDPDQLQILNDWNLFMNELSRVPIIDSTDSLNVTNVLREALPFFDFPFENVDLSEITVESVLPNPLVVAKKLVTPEQWIPFLFLVLKAKKSSKQLVLHWLMACFSGEFHSAKLRAFVLTNTSSNLIEEFLKLWLENRKSINTFPFVTPEFVLSSPHFPLILSTFPSMDHLMASLVPQKQMQQLISAHLAPLMASCLLDEAEAKLKGRKPADFSFLKKPSVTSVKFLELTCSLLSHGQLYPWPVVSLSLQSLAKMFKLSAAPDFSEIFNPLHAIFILRLAVPRISNVFFLMDLFTNVPILSHHPKLLLLTWTLLKEGKEPRTPFEASNLESFHTFVLERTKTTLIEAEDLSSSFSTSSGLLNFVVAFAWSKVFNFPHFSPGLFELVYKIVNMNNSSNGNRMFPLEALNLPKQIAQDLKMLVLPLGSKVLCFDKHKSYEDMTVIDEAEKLLRELCKMLLGLQESTWTHLIVEMFDNYPGERDFMEQIMPFLLDSLNETSKAFSVYPQLIQKLIENLEAFQHQAETSALIIRILHLIVEKTPIGPNVVDTLLRRFAFNPKIFKILQKHASSPDRALYYFSLLRESPKVAQAELDLQEMAGILEGGKEVEYLDIVKKRLSKFDSFDSFQWPEETSVLPTSHAHGNQLQLWLDKKWFDCEDFKPTESSLSLQKFSLQAQHLNNLRNILNLKPSTITPPNVPKIIPLIENCVKNKKSVPNFKEILQLAEEPSKENFQSIALLSLISPKMEQVSRHLLADMSARIHWDRGDHNLALETAKGALNLLPPIMPDESKALLLSRIGEWSAVSKSERPSHILSQYLEKAMNLCENTSSFSPASLAKIHIKVALFVDGQYQQIKESEDFKSRAKLLEESKAALNAARSSSSAISASQDRRQLEISISTLRSQYDLDIQEYSERLRSLNSFLLKSVQNYISALSFGTSNLSESEQMAAVSRLCALWFSNSEFGAVNDLINASISQNSSVSKRNLPLQLFLPLIYQLAARASFDKSEPKASSPFQRTLLRLLVQLTLNFPFDCIYQLLALKAGSSSDSSASSSTKRRKLLDSQDSTGSDRINEADFRAAAASLVIDQTRKVPDLASKIAAVEILVEAYIELANASPPNATSHAINSPNRIDFEKSLKINKLLYPLPTDSPLKQIPIPTGPADGERFAGFIDGYRLLGGINLPKQIEAISTSGNRHAQMVKGRDDVRQDAVMEQVFLRVNRLLSADPETRKRQLCMRTYRVIPLKPLVGLLEWVPNSIPLATYLSEAHERLRPGDLTPSKCRDLLKAEAERSGSTVQSKLNVLLKDVHQRFRPVMRYFFFEHFNIKDWWAAKQAYTSSMATASIVGWIVGLGDRHGMNILLDKKTGQVVHIDLNMIFEAGRTLRIPERVPFRLTPDSVDGLGPEGIGLEGPFKNHAIAALKVLRREKALLMMILDVFKYDPLQKWTGIAKAIENNKPILNSTTNTINTSTSSTDLITKEADRALMRIKEKLEGREEGVVLSEAGHVAFLIQTAMDPELLCQMYFGWQAYF